MATLQVSMATIFACVLLCLSVGWTEANIQEIREPPNIIKPDKQVTLYFSRKAEATLECEAEGRPQPTYKWQKNGEILAPVSGKINFDAVSGFLEIKDFRETDNGDYQCVAEITYANPIPGEKPSVAAALSPIYTMRMYDVQGGPIKDHSFTRNEFTYFKMPCTSFDSQNAPDIQKSWYAGFKTDQIAETDRLFVDAEGTMHFLYLLESDSSPKMTDIYRCGFVVHPGASSINLLDRYNLFVTKVTNPAATAPRLEFSTNSTKKEFKFLLHSDAKLECVFSGYDPNSPTKVPSIKWYDRNGDEIGTNNKYELKTKEYNRVLTIKEIQEDDEGDYFCTGENSLEVTLMMPVRLDLIAPPIFENADARPKQQTKPEGTEATFNCDARSTKDEAQPNPPTWYINGLKTGPHTVPTKHVISPDKKTLTIKNLDKSRDIGCVQCSVENEYGTTWAEGCLNVILKIVIVTQPESTQRIRRGDLIELGVSATTDPSQTLTMQWMFKNKTYPYDDLPHTIVEDDRLFINTSLLTDNEYNNVAGLYELTLQHLYENKVVSVTVELDDPLPTEAPVIIQSAGFPMWIIIVIVAILVVIIIIIIIVCCCLNKRQEGDYNVDKKEVGAGLDPKKELMEKGFDDYSRPNMSDYEDVPRQPLPYDEDVPLTGDDQKSLGEYSEDDEARLGFNEDGSFIGQYYKKDPNQVPSSDYENTTSQSIV